MRPKSLLPNPENTLGKRDGVRSVGFLPVTASSHPNYRPNWRHICRPSCSGSEFHDKQSWYLTCTTTRNAIVAIKNKNKTITENENKNRVSLRPCPNATEHVTILDLEPTRQRPVANRRFPFLIRFPAAGRLFILHTRRDSRV